MSCWCRLTLIMISFNPIFAPFNLRKTNTNDSLEFDCLEYHVNEQQFRGARFKYPIYQKIRYCRRPVSSMNNDIADVSTIDGHQSFSFETLRQMNVTTNQLLLWSASVDQVERYSLYIRRPNALGSEMFINCTPPWFGLRCEYSFDLGEHLFLSQVVEITFQQKTNLTGSRHRLTNLTCFQLLKCDRGTPTCLDWREICNGQIDCQNGAIDEEHCWQLEMNECEPDEYRCHNGLCIPKDFLHDDRNNPDCLDRTDERMGYNTFDSCFQDPTFRCEEQTCHPSFSDFPCGDGQCEALLYSCKNHRDKLFGDSILERGNLSESCWLVMACSTRLNGTINGIDCDTLFTSPSTALEHLHQCESIFQYPIHPIVFGHIRFFYFNNRTELSSTQVLLPDFICYDKSLCDTLPPTMTYANLSCRRLSEIIRVNTSQYANLLKTIASYFRVCSSTYKTFDVIPHSIYQCNRSSKFISNHRLLDNARDCPFNDDEIYQHSCQLNDSFRFQCNQLDNKCFSPIYTSTVCKDRLKDNYTQILFHEFCDGFSHSLVQQIDHYNHTDETDCEQWSCSNMYTRCDDIRHCPNAEDEWNCVSSNCSIGFEPCISPINFTMTCLPYSNVEDGQIDCLGASDEFRLCRTDNTDAPSRRRYRCWNSTKTQCTAGDNLCDGRKQCPNRDDERICPTNSNPCSKTNRSANHDILCQLFDREVEKRNFFTLENVTGIRMKINGYSAVANVLQVSSRPNNPSWSWLCNRGLFARYRHSNNNETYRCFCPPSYYGDSCQYQNERISLTLGFLVADQYQSYTIVVGLIDETNTTLVHDQFPFMGIWGCYRSFNIYLNYPTRPKNLSNSYHLHIDAFDRDAMIYLASWKLKIKFPFLPVNRIASQLILPVQPTHGIRSCPLKCLNGGQCRQYVNSPDLFCHCPSDWFGSRCEKPVDCSYCSSDSLCIGSLTEHATCLCPVDRTGPRCSISVSCQTNICQNNGRCVLIDDQLLQNNYICICLEPFYGTRCELSKIVLNVSLENDEFVSYVLTHVVTTSNESHPVTEVMIKKAVPDQSSVTFYLKEPFHLVFIQLGHRYYLAKESHARCSFIDELISDAEKTMARVRLIKNYPLICSRNIDLSCFFDGYYMCLCTSNRHANCFEFNHNFDLTCRLNDYCENGGSCYQDHQVCPSSTICICTECYFGARCQYYAESLGVTLDDILRYEFRRKSPFSQQNSAVIVTVAITAMMFAIGSISSIASLVTFRGIKVRQVGCGLYLLMASIISFLAVLTLFIKVWFLVGSQLDLIKSVTILRIGCTVVEPILKVLFYIDNWLKACVAIERSITVFRGVNFNKSTSKRIAKWMMGIVPFLTITTTIHEPIYRRLIADEEGQHRNWCVANYSIGLRRYNSIIIIIHFLIPFLINLFSTIFIIASVARQRMLIAQKHRYRIYLCEQFRAHKHTVISPIILILLSLPRLIISLVSNCIKASHDPWLYLIAYFISFTPLVFMFVIFVLPSDLYHAEFKKRLNKRSNVS